MLLAKKILDLTRGNIKKGLEHCQDFLADCLCLLLSASPYRDLFEQLSYFVGYYKQSSILQNLIRK